MNFQQTFEAVKKLLKNKIFLYVAGGVAVVGIIGGAVYFQSGASLRGLLPGVFTEAIKVTSSNPTVTCSFTPANPQVGDLVQYSSLATGFSNNNADVVYAWSDQSLTESGRQNITRQYSQTGDYQVTVTAKSSTVPGEIDSDTCYVKVGTPETTFSAVPSSPTTPTVTCSAFPTSPKVGESVEFTATASGFFDNNRAVVFLWDIPNISTRLEGEKITTSFGEAKPYLVTVTGIGQIRGEQATKTCDVAVSAPNCLSVDYSDWSACNSSGTQTRTVTTFPSGCNVGRTPVLSQACTPAPAPAVTCSYSPAAPMVGDPVEFTAKATGFTFNNAVSFIWSGDAIGAGPTINKIFGTQGIYNVTVKGREITQGAQDSDTCVVNVSILAPTCAVFTYSDWSACQSNNMQTRTVTSSSPSGCTGGTPVLSQACTYVPPITTCTAFDYFAWGACQSNNMQTRTVTSSSPNGCTGGTPVLSQACTYVPPVTTCTAFDYSAWGACQSNNMQTRTVTSSTPSGCTGGTPVLSQACTYVPPVTTCTAFDYSAWGACQSNNTRTRTVTSSSPSGCTGGTPVLSQSCIYTPPVTACTSFKYSDWSACQSNGTRTRTKISSLPDGCTGEPPAANLSQSCTYTTPVAACTTFTYSAWGTCQQNNTQTRTKLTSSPSGCTGGTPILSKACTYIAATPTPTVRPSAPEPSQCPGVNYPKDIDGHWAKAFIKKGYDLCLFKGYSDGTFHPNQNITRAEAVKMTLSAAGISSYIGCSSNSCGTPFTDLDLWQGAWIRSAWDLKIIEGTIPTRFEPNRSLTRAEASAIVARAFKMPLQENCNTPSCDAGYPNNIFTDITESWQGPYIRALWDKGLISGTGPHQFEPNRTITRAELVKIIIMASGN